jgi:hypothetical protein
MSAGGPLSSKGTSTGRGTTVSTKGMISQFAPPAAPTSGGQKGDPLILSVTHLPIQIVVPTAVNSALMAAENIIDSMRAQQPANLVLPSLYKRAYLIAYETDEIAVVKP